MNEAALRSIFTEDWVKFVIILCTLLIIAARFIIGEKFQYLIKFWKIHRYFIYKHGNTINIFNFGNCLFFTLRVVLFSLFISLFLLRKNTFFELINHHYFLIVCASISGYIILKFLIEKILSIILHYKAILNEINMYRIGLKNLIYVHFYFYFLILIFYPIPSFLIIILSLVLLSIYFLFYYSFILKKYEPKTLKSRVYFILYICAFEIAPILPFVLVLKTLENYES